MGRDIPPGAPVWVYLIPLVFIGLAILRNSRTRNLKIERLWIAPTLILFATVLAFSQQHMPTLAMTVADVAALALGAALGWWRGRFITISVDPETHALTSKASVVGMLVILGIFALRSGLSSFARANASAFHATAQDVTDALLLLAVGLVCAQRLEMALRANRLLTEARAAKLG